MIKDSAPIQVTAEQILSGEVMSGFRWKMSKSEFDNIYQLYFKNMPSASSKKLDVITEEKQMELAGLPQQFGKTQRKRNITRAAPY